MGRTENKVNKVARQLERTDGTGRTGSAAGSSERTRPAMTTDEAMAAIARGNASRSS
jgi:hypothetical protein